MRQTSKSIQFTNSLLLKDEVGKSKPTTYDVLPHQDFYGKYTFIDPENAKELSMTWKNHEHSNPIT